MENIDKLKNIVQKQKVLLNALEQEISLIESDDLHKEKHALEATLKKIQQEYVDTKRELEEQKEANTRLKSALYAQVYNEKVRIFQSVVQKMDIYFKDSCGNEQNELVKLESTVNARIKNIQTELQKSRVDAQDEIYQKLTTFSALVEERLTTARANLHYAMSHYSEEGKAEIERLNQAQIELETKQQTTDQPLLPPVWSTPQPLPSNAPPLPQIPLSSANQYTNIYTQGERQQMEHLRNKPVTPKQVHQVTNKANMESFFGLNILNKIGILLIIVGVVTASRYSYLLLPDMLKGILMFVLGGAMLATGEFLSRKKANIFSLGMTAGGVAILYTALSVSYFLLEILTKYPALLLCMLITAIAFVLSTRHRSQTILTFALVGGYLPMLSLQQDKVLLYAAVLYFVVLNLLALLISFRRKWTIATFVGLALNICGTFYICINFYNETGLLSRILSIVYVFFAFLTYTLIPIVGTYQEKIRFKPQDVVLIAINTVFSCLMMYLQFYAFRWSAYDGLLTIFFAGGYLLLGRLIGAKFAQEKKMEALFYLTGFCFVVLTIPLQFGKEWLSLGWLVEGVTLLVYGILNKEKLFQRAGAIIGGLCLASFLLVDVAQGGSLLEYQYLAITLGSLAVLAALVYKKMLAGQWQRLYKNCTLLNIWFYVLYVIQSTVYDLLAEQMHDNGYSASYLLMALSIVATFLLAYAIPRIKSLSGKAIQVIGLVQYSLGILALLFLNFTSGPFLHTITQSVGTTIVGTLILLLLAGLSLLALNDLLRYFVHNATLPIAFYPLILSAYFVILLTQTLITQYNLAFSNAAISIIYVVTALLWIVLGFVQRHAFLRRFGLGLALLAVAKLFLVDLYALTEGYRIVSYFALGITLVGISYVYQYFSKRLEIKVEEIGDVHED